MEIFGLRLRHDVYLIPEWVPRDQNTEADALSRVIDYDDWSFNHEQFLALNKLWAYLQHISSVSCQCLMPLQH